MNLSINKEVQLSQTSCAVLYDVTKKAKIGKGQEFAIRLQRDKISNVNLTAKLLLIVVSSPFLTSHVNLTSARWAMFHWLFFFAAYCDIIIRMLQRQCIRCECN